MQYKVLERSFINNMPVDVGAIVTLGEGIEPGPNLEPVGGALDHDGDGKQGGMHPPLTDPATADEIKAALTQLDGKNDAHWTQAGAPAVEAVGALLPGKTVTRAAITEASPDFKRPEATA